MEVCKKRLHKILLKCDLSFSQNYKNLDVAIKFNKKIRFNLFKVLSVLLIALSVSVYFVLRNIENNCLVPVPSFYFNVFQDPFNCNDCSQLKFVKKATNVSQEDFQTLYASSDTPIIVTDGTKGWRATKELNFDFLKSLYSKVNYQKHDPACNFLRYDSPFTTLQDVFEMDNETKNNGMPWYVGWANCFQNATKQLQSLYTKPYFFQNKTVNMNMVWIFMGSPGRGAPLHIDDVIYPSWQAQIRGRKKWRLVPLPECFWYCSNLEVIVEPGEVIILNTNQWYHETEILPGEISLTIGTEFD